MIPLLSAYHGYSPVLPFFIRSFCSMLHRQRLPICRSTHCWTHPLQSNPSFASAGLYPHENIILSFFFITYLPAKVFLNRLCTSGEDDPRRSNVSRPYPASTVKKKLWKRVTKWGTSLEEINQDKEIVPWIGHGSNDRAAKNDICNFSRWQHPSSAVPQPLTSIAIAPPRTWNLVTSVSSVSRTTTRGLQACRCCQRTRDTP